ncbi:MAG: pantoate--beta-alanine ligase [Gallionellales bacterium 35-53-114]|jgi:pantoate--beta-alanine ligase|nr:MAG: pantoate--beta-alanine ligase [Gallionellales bacterium 35-53-114]OYZ63296.1 MAG: pantoate--beta-alanine ligase [Gallionellales bacterium 24-53-125]OZB08758.1 MAG: pantoate--beta-alanine ligase [Gallionellales bacterium 39-52-133]HQS57366.1 pantoate--beta-alanine ligase [Gallionellaceae bacterium]HQS74446.1 pantoate--beta-alanine ligase [Gallionellaceae bacterium]
MEIISSVAALRQRLGRENSVAFVPTMGNLHEGHLDLVRIAQQHAKCVVVSIFVNPLQFGANEDFGKYPRTLQADCDKLAACGVAIVFAPSEADLYPQPQQVTVEPPPIAQELCGAFRPGHFRGVATVVLKLLNIVQPQVAVFGKKDYQQLHVIRQMVTQLNMPVTIAGAETLRATDGLALSSRNQYLTPAERTEAIFMYQTLGEIRKSLGGGNKDYALLEDKAVKALVSHGWQVDYVAIRSQTALLEPEAGERNLVILAAARLGKTRLIDNIEVCL